MKKGLLLIGTILHLLIASAQDYFFTHYQSFDERDGYQQFEAAQYITQDAGGLLWIGGDNGLFSFDGTHFKAYRHQKRDSTSLPGNWVMYNYGDRQGRYWAWVPNKGLYNFQPRTGTFARFAYSNQREFNIHEHRINLPIETRDGTLWFPLPYFGIARYNRDQNKIIPYKICPPESCGSYYNTSVVTALAEDPDDGTLWAASNDGLVHFFPQDGHFEVHRYTHRTKDDKAQGQVFTALFFDAKKTLWVGTWAFGLRKFDREKKVFEQYRWEEVTTGTKNIVHDLGNYDSEHLWLNTERGLTLFDTRTKSFTPVRKNGVEDEPLYADRIFQNKNGVLWLANTKNLLRINPRENGFAYHSLDSLFKKFPTAGGVYSFVRQGNTLYMGVLEDGFFAAYDLEQHHFTTYVRSPHLNRGIRHLAADSKEDIWIAGSLGTTIFNPATRTFRQPAAPKNFLNLFHLLTSFILHDEDGTTWLGTEKGLVHYNRAAGTARQFTYDTTGKKTVGDNVYYSSTYAVHKDRQGNVWFGNAVVGLGCYRKRTGEIIFFNSSRNQQYPDGNCRSVTEAKDGSILFSLERTGLGILRHPFTKEESLAVLNASDGLPSDNITRVFRDKWDNIWLFSSNGLALFDPVTGATRRFGREDGLAENFLGSKPYQDGEGNIYLGFHRAFQVFHPQRLLAPAADTGAIYLSSLQVNGKDWALSPGYIKTLQLTHQQNNLSFQFAFLSAEHTAGYQYAYQLEGLEKEWNTTGSKTFGQYNNLSPGSYTLRIRARHRNGAWNSNEYRLPVIIQPPWYRTYWFYAFVVLVVVGLATALYRYRVQQLRHESRLKAAFNKKLNETEMRALRAQMNPHFIFNCLNSINRYIVKSDHKTASGYLTKFAKLIRLILDNSAAETIPLDKEIQTLQLYIDMEILRFDNAFTYTIEVDEEIMPESVQIPSMLLQPYVENAIWHGLLHKEGGGGKLWIRFRQPAGNLLIAEVEDNGIGRAQAKELKSKDAIKKKSYGMQISKDRIFLINELYNINAKVQVDDLTDSAGEARGTKVVIEIPVKGL